MNRAEAIRHLELTDGISCREFLHEMGQNCNCMDLFREALNALGVSDDEYEDAIS